MEQPRVGFALTGSFCTLDKALLAMEETAAAYPNIVPILSETTGSTDTRFGRGADFRQAAEEICGHRAVESIREAEPIGPKQLLDVLVIAPCTGNTLAKLAAGIADTAVTMAAKAHLRNGRPVVVAVSTNPGTGHRVCAAVHQRRPGGRGPEHRGTAEPEALLLRPLPPG